MSWPFNKDNPDPANATPPAAGEKTPAELIAESVAAAIKPLADSFAAQAVAQNERFDRIEAATKKPDPVTTPVENTSVLDNEDLAFAQRLTPIMARQLELESRVVLSDIKNEYDRELWAQFEGEIKGVLDATDLVGANGKILRGDPQYIRNVVAMVIGKAAQKSGMRFDGTSKSFFLEPAGGSSNGGANGGPTDGLNDGQRKLLGRMGISTDDAKKVMGKLQFV